MYTDATTRFVARFTRAGSVMESTTIRVGIVDAILGSLRSAGFSIDEAAHAFWLLDSYVYGHIVQEMSMSGTSEPSEPPGPAPESETFSTEYPHLAEMTAHALGGTFSFDGEFTHGLDVILTALRPEAAKLDLDGPQI